MHEHESSDYRIERVLRGERGQVGLGKARLLEIKRGGVLTCGSQNFRRPVNAYDAAARANEFGCQARNGASTATDVQDPLARTLRSSRSVAGRKSCPWSSNLRCSLRVCPSTYGRLDGTTIPIRSGPVPFVCVLVDWFIGRSFSS